jgi:hypothetical protein
MEKCVSFEWANYWEAIVFKCLCSIYDQINLNYNKRCDCMPSDFIGFWVNLLVYWTRTNELHPHFLLVFFTYFPLVTCSSKCWFSNQITTCFLECSSWEDGNHNNVVTWLLVILSISNVIDNSFTSIFFIL